MKKVTIILCVLMFIFLGINYVEYLRFKELYLQNSEEYITDSSYYINNPNARLSKYVGKKVSAQQVKELFDEVNKLNVQEIFPTDIRFGDSLDESYTWSATTEINVLNKDVVLDNGYFEVVVEDQLPAERSDGYLDTITIRPYDMSYILTDTELSISGE